MPEGVPINGRVLVELRWLAGMDQLDLANASCVHTANCNLSPQHISAYEREVKRPGTANLNAILKALRHGLEKKGLELSASMQRALIRTPTLDAASTNGSTIKEDEADRRHANKALAVGGLAFAFFPREAIERIMRHGDRPVDSKLIADHEDLAEYFASRGHTIRRDVLVGQVARQADMLLGLLDRPMADVHRRRLDVITVGAHVQAGLGAFGLGERGKARRFFATAESVANEANDAVLCARTLGVAAVLHSPIESGGRGDSRKAVAVMRRAVHHARRADPATHAYALRWLGLELAAAGDESGFHACFEAAERLPQPQGRPEGHGFLVHYYGRPLERVANEGIGLVRIGRAEEAMDALKPMLDPDSPIWTAGYTAMGLADIALAWVIQGEPEQACRCLRQALDFALDAGYVMGVERIRGVRARFPEPWAGLACVAELDERLRMT